MTRLLAIVLVTLAPLVSFAQVSNTMLSKLEATWNLKCDLDSETILNAATSRQNEFFRTLASQAAKNGLRLEPVATGENASFLGFKNLRYKLGVLIPLELKSDRGERFRVQTRSRDGSGYFVREGLYLQFNPVETGRGKKCKLAPVTSYSIRSGEEKFLPLYQLKNLESKKIISASNFGLYSTKKEVAQTKARPRLARASAKPASRVRTGPNGQRLHGACENRTVEDEINRRPCYYFVSPYLDPTDEDYYTSGYGAQLAREQR